MGLYCFVWDYCGEDCCDKSCDVEGFYDGNVYGNSFCRMVFVRVIEGHVSTMKLCSSGTGYVGTVGCITVINLGCVWDV